MRRRAVARLLFCFGWVAGPVWLRWRVRRHMDRAEPLDARARARLHRWFSEDVLDAVRVARIERIDLLPPPIERVLLRVDPSAAVHPAGLTLGDLVLISREGRRGESVLLFHELVHVVQYRVLGHRRFFGRYLAGWAEAGFDYFRIPLEVQAFALQERFMTRRDEAFSVDRAVRGALEST